MGARMWMEDMPREVTIPNSMDMWEIRGYHIVR
jgi:hypothetical protein